MPKHIVFLMVRFLHGELIMKEISGCSSKQIIIFVEGDTDEVFFKALLDYYKSSSQMPLTPCEVINLKGVTRYTSKLLAKLRNEILPEAKRKNTSIRQGQEIAFR